jgi:hypothetical protein
MARIWRRQTDNAEAYDMYPMALEGFESLYQADNRQGQQLLSVP